MNPTRRILQIIDHADRRWGLLPREGGVLVAFSGGADSTALLEALCLMRRRRSLRIGAAHLDHRLARRSGAWAEHCRRIALELDVPYHAGSLDAHALKAPSGGSLEQAARAARYEFLARTARERGYAAVATAHTADDQAETFLMRLFRGAGPWGLGGIPARRPIDERLIVVRPLLDVRRTDVLAFLKERRRAYLSDPSNRDTDLFRNEIRLRILPYLNRRIGPSVYTRLVQAAQSCASLSDALESRMPIGAGPVSGRGSRKVISPAAYRALPDAYRMASLRSAIRGALGHLRRITSRHLAALNDLVLTGRPGARIDLPGVRAQVESAGVVLSVIPSGRQGSIDTGAGRGYNLALNDQGGETACPKSKSDRTNRSKRRSSVLRRRSNAKASLKS